MMDFRFNKHSDTDNTSASADREQRQDEVLEIFAARQPEIERRLRLQVADFKVRLEQHPYARRVERNQGGRWWFAMPAFQAVAAVAVIVAVAGGFYTMWRGGTTAPGASYRIMPGSGVGEITLRMPKQGVYSLWGQPEHTDDAGALAYYSKGAEVKLDEHAAVATISCYHQSARDGKFATFKGSTTEGARVGSSEVEVTRLMGQPAFKAEVVTANAPDELRPSAVLVYNSGVRFYLQAQPAGAGSSTAYQCDVVPAGSISATAFGRYSRGTASVLSFDLAA